LIQRDQGHAGGGRGELVLVCARPVGDPINAQVTQLERAERAASGIGRCVDVPANHPLVALARRSRPAARLSAAPFEPEPGDLGDGQRGSLDPLAQVHARDQLGALGLRVGFAGALDGLPDLPSGRVAVGELVLAGDAFAALAVDPLVDAFGDAHPPRVWSPPGFRRRAVLGQWIVHGS
jgi:hypothetical protein